MTDWISANRSRLIAIGIPVVVVAACYFFIVQPRAAAGRRATEQTVAIRARLNAIPRSLAAPPKTVARTGDALQELERRIPVADRVPDLLERLARVALNSSPPGDVRGLKVETADRVDVASPNAQTGPRVASGGADQPDPRLPLFAASLSYAPISVSFEATYPALGRFLWNLRDLPTTIEIRSLDVARPSAADEGRFLKVELVLFAFQRAASKAS